MSIWFYDEMIDGKMYYKFLPEDRLWYVYYPDGSPFGEFDTEEEAREACGL